MDTVANVLPSALANGGGPEGVGRGEAIMQSMQSPVFNIVFILCVIGFIALTIYLRKKNID